MTSEEKSISDKNRASRPSWYEMTENEFKNEQLDNDQKIAESRTLEQKLNEDDDVHEDDFYDEIFISNSQENAEKPKEKTNIQNAEEVSSDINSDIKKESLKTNVITEIRNNSQTESSTTAGDKLFSDIIKGKIESVTDTNSKSNINVLSNIITNALHVVTPVKKDEGTITSSCPIKLTCLDSDDNDDDDSDDNESDNLQFKREYKQDETSQLIGDVSKFRKRFRDSSSSSCNDSEHNGIGSPKRKKKQFEIETDPIVLARRQKQIEFGKNSLDYDEYIKTVPRHKREKHHPKTPPKHMKCSRRGWDGLIKIWKQQIHTWSSAQKSTKAAN